MITPLERARRAILKADDSMGSLEDRIMDEIVEARVEERATERERCAGVIEAHCHKADGKPCKDAAQCVPCRQAAKLRNPEKDGELPHGCLGCNKEEIEKALRASGVDPARFEEVPRPRHNWGDIVACNDCGRAWLIDHKRTER